LHEIAHFSALFVVLGALWGYTPFAGSLFAELGF